METQRSILGTAVSDLARRLPFLNEPAERPLSSWVEMAGALTASPVLISIESNASSVRNARASGLFCMEVSGLLVVLFRLDRFIVVWGRSGDGLVLPLSRTCSFSKILRAMLSMISVESSGCLVRRLVEASMRVSSEGAW